jgi:hypothetical protein
MKLFISYPSAQRDLAARLALALEAEGHDVFHDRSDLNAGESFHQRLREAVAAADAFVFLITPEAVAPGSYTLAELNFAQEHWRRPSGHVLPVMVVPTPIGSLPPYLSAVTILQPSGELVAETVATVAKLKPGGAGQGAKIALGLALALALAGGLGYVGVQRSAAEKARQEQQTAQQRNAAQGANALKLCEDGSYAAALAQLNTLAAKPPPLDSVQAAREDCAMLWLRNMHAVEGQLTFADQVAQTEPVLMQALSTASGAPTCARTWAGATTCAGAVAWWAWSRSAIGSAPWMMTPPIPMPTACGRASCSTAAPTCRRRVTASRRR